MQQLGRAFEPSVFSDGARYCPALPQMQISSCVLGWSSWKSKKSRTSWYIGDGYDCKTSEGRWYDDI